MIYPIVVLTAAFTILLLLMWKVIPKFTSVLTEMTEGAELPKLTQVVLKISGWIAYSYGWAVLLAVEVTLKQLWLVVYPVQPSGLLAAIHLSLEPLKQSHLNVL